MQSTKSQEYKKDIDKAIEILLKAEGCSEIYLLGSIAEGRI